MRSVRPRIRLRQLACNLCGAAHDAFEHFSCGLAELRRRLRGHKQAYVDCAAIALSEALSMMLSIAFTASCSDSSNAFSGA